MLKTHFALSIVLSLVPASHSFAAAEDSWNNDVLTATVTEVTDAVDSTSSLPAPIPSPTPDDSGGLFPTDPPLGGSPGGSTSSCLTNGGTNNGWGSGGWSGGWGSGWGGGWGTGKIDLSTLLTVGEKVWDFIVNNKPCAEYQTMKAAILPGGTKSFTQLSGWSKPVAKVYRVQFKNRLGKDAGGFSYRISFVFGGSYQGKGKFIGQIAFTPLDIKLKTDRQLNIHAEVLDPINYGSEDDPLAGVQLLIRWSSPTTLRYTMNSIEYFFYGNGEVQDISNGTNSGKLPQL